jgi:6-phosphofructokinase
MDLECRQQNLKCSIVGVPKSIDNDILLIDRCFGFETAVDEAQRALLAAKVEAKSALRCALVTCVAHLWSWFSTPVPKPAAVGG